MNESKATCLLVLVVLLAVYHLHRWLTGDHLVDCPAELGRELCSSRALDPAASGAAAASAPPPFIRADVAPAADACSLMDLLTLRAVAPRRCRLRERLAAEHKGAEDSPNAGTVTVVMLLLLSVLKSVHDVVRSRREAALRREREPEEQRRRSLAEFADRAEKKARRFCEKPTLLQLTEPFLASRRAPPPPQLARADSSNSYLAERAPAPEPTTTPQARSSAADCTPPPAADLKRGAAVKLFAHPDSG